MTSNIGEEYNIEPVTEFARDGSKYTLRNFDADTTGIFTEENQTVSFIYELNKGILSSNSSKGLGIVEIDYVDTNGNNSPHVDYETGVIGEQYTIQEIIASVVNGNVYRVVER